MEHSAVEKTLGNPLILQKILNSVGTSDLLNCRLVAKTNWVDLSTEILSCRRALQISFTHLEHESNEEDEKMLESSVYQDHWKKPGFFTDTTDNQWPLRSVTELIENTNRFYCGSFRFAEGFIEDDEDFAHFIKIYGHRIAELELDLLTQRAGNYVVQTMGKILMLLPNLESLIIGKVSLGWSTIDRLFSKKIRQDFKLPKLTSIQIGQDVNSNLNFLNDLKAAAPNLRVFQEYSLPKSRAEVARLLGDKDKDGICNNLNFEINENNIKIFEKVARARPKFRSLTVNLNAIKEMSDPIQARNQLLARISSALIKIFNESRNTLRILNNIEQLELLPDFEIPPLTAVNSLGIKIVNKFLTDEEHDLQFENRECFHIKNLNFPVTFPALKFVELELPSMDSMEIGGNKNLRTNLQLNWTPTTTVTDLQIHSECSRFISPGFIHQLGPIFFMVEKLQIGHLPNFLELALNIWDHFPQLIELSVIMIKWSDKIEPLTLVEKSLQIRLDPHPQFEDSPKMVMERKFSITLVIPGLGLSTCEEDRHLMSDWVRLLKVESEKMLLSGCLPIKNLVLPSVTSLQLVVPSRYSSEKLDLKQLSEKNPIVYHADLKTTWTPTNNKTSLTMTSASFDFPPTTISQMGQSFSSLKKLELKEIENFPAVAPVIWTNFPKLINFYATIYMGVNCTPDMFEEALGIYPKHVAATEGNLRTNPAISDLRGLEAVAVKLLAGDLTDYESDNEQWAYQIKLDLQKVLPNCSVVIN